MRIRVLILFALTLLVLHACQKENDTPDDTNDMTDPMVSESDTALFDLNNVPFENLSDYHFFINPSELEPHPSLIPYDLNTALFSNYSSKQRLVYLPPETSATYVSEGQLTLDFPEGTVIAKTFYYLNNFNDPSQGQRIIETRLLVRREGKWEAYEYLWNEEQTDATRIKSGAITQVEWTHYDGVQRNEYYIVPTQNDCKGCHELGEDLVLLGPKARFLNKDYAYADGTMNQLQKWESLGKLTGLPDMSEVPKAATWGNENESLNDRARAYLDINCAHCHNDAGPANNSGLFLDFYETDSTKLGFCKPPVAAGGGSGGLFYSIAPGNPDESIMIYRLNSLVPDESMPELGRSVIHEEGLQLLRDWVSSINGECQ